MDVVLTGLASNVEVLVIQGRLTQGYIWLTGPCCREPHSLGPRSNCPPFLLERMNERNCSRY